MKTIVWKNTNNNYTVLTECHELFMIDGVTGEKEYAGAILNANDLKRLDVDGERVKHTDLPTDVYAAISKLS